MHGVRDNRARHNRRWQASAGSTAIDNQTTRFATRRRHEISFLFSQQVYTRNASIARQPEEHGRRRAKVHVKSWGSLIDTLTDHGQIDITGKQLQINLLVQRFLALLVEVLPHQTHVCERAYESAPEGGHWIRDRRADSVRSGRGWFESAE